MTILKYAPDFVSLYSPTHGALHGCPVVNYSAHAPGTHPGSPLRDTCTALACLTQYGTRWYGFADAYIDSSLRMVCVLSEGQERDEVVMGWEDAK